MTRPPRRRYVTRHQDAMTFFSFVSFRRPRSSRWVSRTCLSLFILGAISRWTTIQGLATRARHYLIISTVDFMMLPLTPSRRLNYISQTLFSAVGGDRGASYLLVEIQLETTLTFIHTPTYSITF